MWIVFSVHVSLMFNVNLAVNVCIISFAWIITKTNLAPYEQYNIYIYVYI